jgi:hypothetical protein
MKPFAVLLLLAVSVWAAPIPKQLKKKGLGLNGTWEAQSIMVGNVTYPIRRPMLWKIDGVVAISDFNDDVTNKEYELIPLDAEFPRSLNLIVTKNGQKLTHLGIGELDGDTWKFCLNISPDNTVRPIRMEQNKDVYLYTFKRVK